MSNQQPTQCGQAPEQATWVVIHAIETAIGHAYWVEHCQGSLEKCQTFVSQAMFPSSLKIISAKERHNYKDY